MNGQIITDLYTKQTNTHDYLHRSSFHPPSLIRSIPKTQFIHLRRICSRIIDFDTHCKDFIDHFIRRGYSEKSVRKTAIDVSAMDRNDLLTNNHLKPTSSNRVVLTVKWHRYDTSQASYANVTTPSSLHRQKLKTFSLNHRWSRSNVTTTSKASSCIRSTTAHRT